MAKANKKKVTADEFFRYYLDKTGIPDPRDAKDALDVFIGIQKLYGGILETLGVLTVLLSKEGLMSFTISPHLLDSPEQIDMVLKALTQLEAALEKAKTEKTTEPG